MTTPDDQPNALECLQTAPEIYGFIFREYGAEGLRQLLTMTSSLGTRESLQKDARELHSVGLTQASAIVAQAAKQAPRTIDTCPYPENLDHVVGNETNRSIWLNLMRKMGFIKSSSDI